MEILFIRHDVIEVYVESKGKKHEEESLDDLGLDGKITLKCI